MCTTKSIASRAHFLPRRADDKWNGLATSHNQEIWRGSVSTTQTVIPPIAFLLSRNRNPLAVPQPAPMPNHLKSSPLDKLGIIRWKSKEKNPWVFSRSCLRRRIRMSIRGARVDALFRLATSPRSVRAARHHHVLVLLDAVRRNELVASRGLLLLGWCPGKEVSANLDVIVSCRKRNVSTMQSCQRGVL